jgi:hypothetical protein
MDKNAMDSLFGVAHIAEAHPSLLKALDTPAIRNTYYLRLRRKYER